MGFQKTPLEEIREALPVYVVAGAKSRRSRRGYAPSATPALFRPGPFHRPTDAARPRPRRDNWTISAHPSRAHDGIPSRSEDGHRRKTPGTFDSADPLLEARRKRRERPGERIGVTAAWHRQFPSVDEPETPNATAAVRSGGGNPRPSGRGGCQ
ncbi:hypothetical protein AArcCO_4098 (plasmid) [Halalkaliarchaeum sp. AArc-CO]|nr:hypothetical protein AArcCO_4098 [Halalkaliarchaeum sp. AArc-CO]